MFPSPWKEYFKLWNILWLLIYSKIAVSILKNLNCKILCTYGEFPRKTRYIPKTKDLNLLCKYYCSVSTSDTAFQRTDDWRREIFWCESGLGRGAVSVYSREKDGDWNIFSFAFGFLWWTFHVVYLSTELQWRKRVYFSMSAVKVPFWQESRLK